MKIRKIAPKIVCLVLICITLYVLMQGIILFFRGFHNLDSAFNYLNLGYTADLTTEGFSISLTEAYLLGLNQIKTGFYWICFSVILAFLSGFFLKKAK